MIITCPHCQAEHDYKVIDHINIDRNPELRAKVQDLSCFRIKCPNCGETELAVHPCLYTLKVQLSSHFSRFLCIFLIFAGLFRTPGSVSIFFVLGVDIFILHVPYQNSLVQFVYLVSCILK